MLTGLKHDFCFSWRSFAVVGCNAEPTIDEPKIPKIVDVLNLIHEQPMEAERIVDAVLREGHGGVDRQPLRRNAQAAKLFIGDLLNDPDFGLIVRERCEAPLAANLPPTNTTQP